MRFDIGKLYERVIWVVVDVLIFLLLVELVVAVIGVALKVWDAVRGVHFEAVKEITVEALTVFIFIEILHSLLGYVNEHRIRVSDLADASIAFVLRELWIGLYGEKLGWEKIGALALLVIALAVLRTLAIRYGSPPPIGAQPSKPLTGESEA